MQPCLQFSPEPQHGHTWDKKRQRRRRKPQPPAGLGVCDFCSFQGASRKKVIGKAAAREVALLFVFWFLKLSVETFCSGRKTALSLKNIWLCQKKAFFGGNETLLLEKTNKSNPAHTGSQLRSWGASVQRGWLSIPRVHAPSLSSWSIIMGRASWWSQLIHLPGLTYIHSVLVPGPPLWPSSPAKPPPQNPLGFSHAKGLDSLLGQELWWRNSMYFGVSLATSSCLGAKAEGVSHETPPG